MSQLVSDILINPVLRQARRFSRSLDNQLPLLLPPPPETSLREHETSIELPSAQTAALDIPSEPHQGDNEHVPSHPRDTAALAALTPLTTSLPVESANPRGTSHPPQQETSLSSHAMNGERSQPETQPGLNSNEATTEPTATGQSDMLQVTSVTPVASGPATLHRPEHQWPIESTREHPHEDEQHSSSSVDMDPSAPPRRETGTLLPENDGMGVLRQRIMTIQEMDISASDKARLMHELFTADYQNHHQNNMVAKLAARPHSPESIISQEMPHSPNSPFKFWQTGMTGSSPTPSTAEPGHTFYLTPEDLEPTYAPNVSDAAHESSDDEDGYMRTLGCEHYKRNVKLQCSACHKWYTCRFCHDEVEDHQLNRRETKNMLCMACGYAQPASDECIDCGISAACYYCRICKLWDNDPTKSIYHCDDCGICRVGEGLGKDYIHCKTCGVCMSITRWGAHKCLERSVDCNCPICEEYLLTSTRSVVFMRCGHCIHQDCYESHLKTSYKCPICNKSTINMETQFLELERAIESQPMPPQFESTRALVKCNDCLVKCVVKYHWLGLKCSDCQSYNTREIQILNAEQAQELEQVTEQRRSVDGRDQAMRRMAVERTRNITIPSRLRRHSSHQGPTDGPLSWQTPLLSLASFRRRFGRSVSPPNRTLEITREHAADEGEDKAAFSDGDEEDIGFWHGLGHRYSGSSADEDSDGDDESASGSEQEDDEDEEDDEADIIGQMELIGHR